MRSGAGVILSPAPYEDLMTEISSEPSEAIGDRVSKARELQSARFSRAKIYCNAQMSSRHIRKHCRIDDTSATLLETAVDKLVLSTRTYNRILKIARTIADLDVSPRRPGPPHLQGRQIPKPRLRPGGGVGGEGLVIGDR